MRELFFGRVSALSETLEPGAPEYRIDTPRNDAKPQAKDEREECLDDVPSLEELKARRDYLKGRKLKFRVGRERLSDRERAELQRRENRDRGRFWKQANLRRQRYARQLEQCGQVEEAQRYRAHQREFLAWRGRRLPEGSAL